jgi:hypothetical protein
MGWFKFFCLFQTAIMLRQQFLDKNRLTDDNLLSHFKNAFYCTNNLIQINIYINRLTF